MSLCFTASILIRIHLKPPSSPPFKHIKTQINTSECSDMNQSGRVTYHLKTKSLRFIRQITKLEKVAFPHPYFKKECVPVITQELYLRPWKMSTPILVIFRIEPLKVTTFLYARPWVYPHNKEVTTVIHLTAMVLSYASENL